MTQLVDLSQLDRYRPGAHDAQRFAPLAPDRNYFVARGFDPVWRTRQLAVMTIKIHSRYCQRVGLLLVLGVVVPRASSGQQNGEGSRADHRTIRESSGAIGPRLVSSDQGLAIIGAALESRRPADANADCSNLVHAIYERAGFTYPYSNSSELFRGIKEFGRVFHPQPGDLVVWRGHVGIVISPVQHSFFSAMRSGRGVEFYDSRYWLARGQPRFFRYLKTASRTQFSASIRNPDLQPRSSRKSDSHGPVPSEIQGPRATSLHDSESQTTSDRQSVADRNKQTPASQQIHGLGDGDWVKTATKPSPGIPFDAADTSRRPDEPRPPQGLRTSNMAADTGHAGAKPTSASRLLENKSKTEPVQWATSRYVPRPPWSSSSGRTSEPSVPRPTARPAADSSQGLAY